MRVLFRDLDGHTHFEDVDQPRGPVLERVVPLARSSFTGLDWGVDSPQTEGSRAGLGPEAFAARMRARRGQPSIPEMSVVRRRYLLMHYQTDAHTYLFYDEEGEPIFHDGDKLVVGAKWGVSPPTGLGLGVVYEVVNIETTDHIRICVQEKRGALVMGTTWSPDCFQRWLDPALFDESPV